MAQFVRYASNFTLTSKYTCGTEIEYRYKDSSHTDYTRYTVPYVASNPTTAKKTITFGLSDLPKGANVKNATLYVTIGTPTIGVKTSTINGVGVGVGSRKTIPFTINEGATSVSFTFAFTCNAEVHSHNLNDGGYTSENHPSYWDGDSLLLFYFKDHEDSLTYSSIYLVVEYEGSEDTGCIYRAERGQLVPYNCYRAENGVLVQYQFFHSPIVHSPPNQFYTSDGKAFYTSDGENFKTLGG